MDRRRELIALAALVVATVAVYVPVARHDFIHFDDGNQLFFKGSGQMRHSASAAADLGKANFVVGIRRMKNVEWSSREYARSQGRTLYK